MPYVAVLKMKMVANISSQHKRGSSGSSCRQSIRSDDSGNDGSGSDG